MLLNSKRDIDRRGAEVNMIIILPAKSRSDVMFCLQSYGTYLS